MPASATRHPFFIVLLVAASAALFAILFGFWKSIFWAAVFGILFRPVQTRLEARLDGRESVAAMLTVILIFFTVLVPAMLISVTVAAEAKDFLVRIQSGDFDVGGIVSWLQGLLPQAGAWAGKFGVDIDELPDKLSAAAVEGSQFVAAWALGAFQNAASFVMLFFLMLYLLFFVLRDGDEILLHLNRAMPLPDELERQLFTRFAEVARATIKGTLLVAMAQGFLGGVIFALLGIQGAVFWGVVMAVLSLVPAIGAGLVWAPTAVYLLMTGEWTQGLVLAVYGVLVIGLIDNLLRPILVGRDTRMPDYLILFSTIGGLGLVGVSGFVLGPVIASLFVAVWQMFEQGGEPEVAAVDRPDGDGG